MVATMRLPGGAPDGAPGGVPDRVPGGGAGPPTRTRTRPRTRLLGLAMALATSPWTTTAVEAQLPSTTLRIMVADELSTTSKTAGRVPVSPGDGGTEESLWANFFLAADHFNNRRADVLPALANVSSWCATQLQVTSYCDTQCTVSYGFNDVAALYGGVDVVVGTTCNVEAGPISVGAQALGNIPVVSHAASSSKLADKTAYPLFARTVPSDQANVNVVATYLTALGYTKVAASVNPSNNATTFLGNLQAAFNGTVTAFGSAGDAASAEESFLAIKASGLKVVLMLQPFLVYPTLAQGVAAAGMLLPDVLFVWPLADSAQGLAARALAYDNVTMDMMSGSLAVVAVNLDNAAFTNYAGQWAANGFAAILSTMNEHLPPQGLRNSNTSCANDGYDFQVPPTYFPTYAPLANLEWAYAYDAMMAVGLASCYANADAGAAAQTLGFSTGNVVLDAMLALDFGGMSGRVVFTAEGDRDPNYMDFEVLSLFAAPDSDVLEAAPVAALSANQWTLNTSAAVFRDGTNAPPLQLIPPAQDYNWLPIGLKVLGYVEAALIVGASLACAAWAAANRRTRVLVNGQAYLLIGVAMGVAVSGFAVAMLTIDGEPGVDVGVDPNAACTAFVFLMSVGTQLALLCIIARAVRIMRIFLNTKMRRRVVREWHMAAAVAASVAAELVVLAVWTAVAPLRWTRVVTASDVNGFPTDSYGACLGSSDATGAFAGVVFGMHGVSALLSALFAWRVRNVPATYHDRNVGLALVVLAQIYLVAVPTIVAVYSSVVARFVVASTAFFLGDGRGAARRRRRRGGQRRRRRSARRRARLAAR